MSANTELLNFVYQNSQMGVETIDKLMDITDNEEFKSHIKRQWEEYEEINSEAKKMLTDAGCDEKGIGKLEKLKTYMMINIQTLKDKSPSHIAEMLMIGSNMGVIDAVKNIKKYYDADKEVINLMGKLLETEENNLQKLRRFL